MMKTNSEFKKQTVESIVGFLENPANRMVDVIPDLFVHAAQCWSWF